MNNYDLDNIQLPFVNATQRYTYEDIKIAFENRGIKISCMTFSEEELFPNESTQYPLFPFLVVEAGTREYKPVIKDEVKDLYWI